MNLHKEHHLPIWGLPQNMQEVLTEVSACKNAPIDYCTSSMVGVVASVIRKGLKLTYNEYSNYPCLWLILVGNSSKGKSPVLNWFCDPLRSWSKWNNDEYDKAVSEWRKQGSEGVRPTPKDFVIQDMTAEARNYAMKRNDEQGVLVLSDELGSFFGCFARYNGTAAKEISDLNSAFDSSPIKIDRADPDKRLTINEPFLNIIGGVQEDRVGNYFGSEIMMDSGFNQRCMFVFPDQESRTRNKSKISEETKEKWDRYISRLLAKFANGDADRMQMDLSSEAANLFDDYSDSLADKEDAADDSYLVSLHSKHRYFVLRWAMIAAFMNGRYSVSEEDMRYSIECMDYFEHSALKVYDLIRHPEKKITKAEAIRTLAGDDGKGIKNQTQFAELIGVSQSYISQLLKK